MHYLAAHAYDNPLHHNYYDIITHDIIIRKCITKAKHETASHMQIYEEELNMHTLLHWPLTPLSQIWFAYCTFPELDVYLITFVVARRHWETLLWRLKR